MSPPNATQVSAYMMSHYHLKGRLQHIMHSLVGSLAGADSASEVLGTQSLPAFHPESNPFGQTLLSTIYNQKMKIYREQLVSSITGIQSSIPDLSLTKPYIMWEILLGPLDVSETMEIRGRKDFWEKLYLEMFPNSALFH